MINILTNSYVRLASVHGSELDIVNAARVSYQKESSELSKRDISLLKFLLAEGHTSPFRHVSLTYECYVPLFVARQHWKYVVGSTMTSEQQGWNESSRRYITEEPEFYFPESWRLAPENSKQGSGNDMSATDSDYFNGILGQYIDTGLEIYYSAIDSGVAPELARLFLPAYGMLVRYRWTASLSGVLHFLDQRLKSDAQYEIQQLAKAVLELTQAEFPNVFEAYYDR